MGRMWGWGCRVCAFLLGVVRDQGSARDPGLSLQSVLQGRGLSPCSSAVCPALRVLGGQDSAPQRLHLGFLAGPPFPDWLLLESPLGSKEKSREAEAFFQRETGEHRKRFESQRAPQGPDRFQSWVISWGPLIRRLSSKRKSKVYPVHGGGAQVGSTLRKSLGIQA